MKKILPFLLVIALLISFYVIKTKRDDKGEMVKSLIGIEFSLNNSNSKLHNLSIDRHNFIAKEAEIRPEIVTPFYKRGREVMEFADNVIKYIEILKREWVDDAESRLPEEKRGERTPMSYLNQDNIVLDVEIFDKKKAKEFTNKLDSIRDKFYVFLKDGEGVTINPKLREAIKSSPYLLTNYNNEKHRSWGENNFDNSSLGQMVVELSKLQNDIRNFEADILIALARSVETCWNIVLLEAKVIPNARMIKVGTEYRAEILLVASNSKSDNPVIVNGDTLPMKKGKGIYSTIPTTKGVHYIEGVIQVRGPSGIKEFPFKEKFEAF